MAREVWRLSPMELVEIERAMNRDVWASEFNSLPTAIERVYQRKFEDLSMQETEGQT